MADARTVADLLADRTYHIEFNGHLTNHVKHAVVALAGLGADLDRIRAYHDQYARLTPYGYGLEQPVASQHVITESNWQRFLGRRTSFSAYCEFFAEQEQRIGMDTVLARYVPVLLAGWVGAFTHATIHLGWGLDAGSRWMTVEGLAYMAFSYDSCHPQRSRTVRLDGMGDERAVDSLLRIAAAWEESEGALAGWVEEIVADTDSPAVADIHPELARSGLQYRIARVLAEGHPLISETPAWIDEQDVDASWEQLYYAVTLLYLTQPGDFVLLHLITSLYAMEQIAQRLGPDEQRYAVRCFWIGMLCIVFSQARFPTTVELESLHRTYRDAFDPPAASAVREDWEEIVAQALTEDEEHNPKMVYVLRGLWSRTGDQTVYREAAACFTTTPELPKTFDLPPTP